MGLHGLLQGCLFVFYLTLGLSGMDWIGLAQDRDQWRALVNTVMYLLVP
jgi:predicted small integral membrane protein